MWFQKRIGLAGCPWKTVVILCLLKSYGPLFNMHSGLTKKKKESVFVTFHFQNGFHLLVFPLFLSLFGKTKQSLGGGWRERAWIEKRSCLLKFKRQTKAAFFSYGCFFERIEHWDFKKRTNFHWEKETGVFSLWKILIGFIKYFSKR